MSARYTATGARGAVHLANWLIASANMSARVDWEPEVNLRLTRGEKVALQEQFGQWLRKHRNVTATLTHWAAEPGRTTQGVITELQTFSRLVNTMLDVATILKDAAVVLRNEGWIQGEKSDVEPGFDLVGAIGRSCELHRASPMLRVATLEALRDTLQDLCGGFPTTVTDWNDVRGRTKRDVLHALSTCADVMVFI